MNTKKAFEETGRLGNEVTRLRRELEQVNGDILKIMKECPHEIVFKYHDAVPRMLHMDSNCFCPACGMTLQFIYREQIQKSDFKDSKVIPLERVSFLRKSENYRAIRKEVYDNMDVYYDPEAKVEDLAIRMESILKEIEIEHKHNILVLRRNARSKR